MATKKQFKKSPKKKDSDKGFYMVVGGIVVVTAIGLMFFRQQWAPIDAGAKFKGNDLFARKQKEITPEEMRDITSICAPLASCIKKNGCDDEEQKELVRDLQMSSMWGKELATRLKEDGFEVVQRDFAKLLRDDGLATRSSECRQVAYSQYE